MTMEQAIQIQQQFKELNDRMTLLEQHINGIKIDDQTHVKSNKPIPSGVATKIAYDSKGLVVSGSNISAADIPELPIDKISGLERSLRDKCTRSDIETLRKEFQSAFVMDPTVAATGIKINYNSDGRVLSSSGLNEDDIPTLHTSKIDGLDTILEYLKEQHLGQQSEPQDDQPSIRPGSYCKVLVDECGRVSSGTNLTMSDMPEELSIRLNTIESRFPEYVSTSSFNSIRALVDNKLDANAPATPGTYTKVSIDKKGLVIQGSQLQMSDLPSELLNRLTKLEESMATKVDYSEMSQIHETQSLLISDYNRISKLTDEQKLLVTHNLELIAEKTNSLQSQVDTAISVLNTYADIAPPDVLQMHLDNITSTVDQLTSRVTSIESSMNL